MNEGPVTLFLCGDVMTGRGVDQVLPHPSEPQIHEPWIDDARAYVELAERVNGPIPRPVDFAYIWGDEQPRARLRRRGAPRDPRRADEGRREDRRRGPNPRGSTRARGDRLAGKGRLVVFAFGTETSGIPPSSAATDQKPGLDFLWDLSDGSAGEIQERVQRVKRATDIVVASIHWGTNWGYDVPAEHLRFARWLLEAGVDVVHGHSPHHPRPIEVYEGKLVLYGCGDFINDYEGIHGHDEFRDDLTLMYFAGVDPSTGELEGLK